MVLLFCTLAVYSAGLLAVDVVKGQETARGFFSDIVAGDDYPLPDKGLYGLNTSLCVIFLTGTALLHAVSVGASRDERFPWFEVSQVVFYLYLAADDRLRIHEKLGERLGMDDAYLLLALGVAQVFLLIFLGRVQRQAWRLKGCLLAAGGLFFLMVVIDAFLPDEMKGRLAMEDLAKLWAVVFLFLHAWRHCAAKMIGAPDE